MYGELPPLRVVWANIHALDFSNIVKKSSLERMAEADDHEVVRVVQEYFIDYLVINPDLFSLSIAGPQKRIWGTTSSDMWNPDALMRTTEGLVAALLTLKKKPHIRYEKNSLLAKKLAQEVKVWALLFPSFPLGSQTKRANHPGSIKYHKKTSCLISGKPIPPLFC